MLAFDVVVIGAGHAGCEASLAAARTGAKVAVVTLKRTSIAQMSCNPAIGGVGKGHLVREIDALGGAMGQAADATGIQFRRLNISRGPAVQATRAQADSQAYRTWMTEYLLGCDNITLIEDEVVDLHIDAGCLQGVLCANQGYVRAGAVVVTTGTFLNGVCHVGNEQFSGGRIGDVAAQFLSQTLQRIGLQLGRFKTGTTPRLHANSIRWEVLAKQLGDTPRPCFSFDNLTNGLPQISCAITATNPKTHAILRDNLCRSPLYQGIIEGRGPRYCPSLEDKIVRFAERDRHQIFLEPEGLHTNWVYPNGLSTSMPKDVQLAFLRSIEGLEQVEVVQYGYAVEYDYVQPTQLQSNLMTKSVAGLFLAGQINGTSGYEEAAAQGLMAGLNASRYVAGLPPAILERSDAYIGVLLDDLVTQGVDEPYRMFTSRAEHRLTLREHNAEERLFAKASAWGLLSTARQQAVQKRQQVRQLLLQALQKNPPNKESLRNLNIELSANGMSTWGQLLKRPNVHMAMLWPSLQQADPELAAKAQALPEACLADMFSWAESEYKYAGFIARESRDIVQLKKLEAVHLSPQTDYLGQSGLSYELQEKLQAIQPTTLAQASRIPGMTPAALLLLRAQLARGHTKKLSVA